MFGYTNASWTLRADLVCRYVCRLLNHMERTGTRQCTPRLTDASVTPVPWVDQYVFKPVKGLLFSRAETMDSRVWLRDADPRPLDAVSLTAICDTPFPSPWIRLSEQLPVSTVAYSVYFRAADRDYAEAGSSFCLLDTRASLARGGYFDQFTSVWSESGILLVQTKQMLWFADAGTR